MSTQHTPGPWEAEINMIVAHVYTKADIYPRTVADLIIPVWAATSPDSTTRNRVAADAQLIAAAPDLLSALQDIYEMCEGYVPNTSKAAWSAARIAIAKATGEQA